MQTSAVGNKVRLNTPKRPPSQGRAGAVRARARGVTLLELLVVVALMALASA
ncbi:MAG: prepilin-type N-terminal cleavage/methylation domain-containing protein, partial [Limnohabitans sp.]|nr:prepilin-type N-terminal cleavage/methylation domain-containing protein [Limnohabitans sp.]